MPTRLCSTARCPDPATYRGYCTTHAQQRNRETHTNKSIYSSKRWQMLRRKVLFEEPLCSCGEIATDVDHIQPIERGRPALVKGEPSEHVPSVPLDQDQRRDESMNEPRIEPTDGWLLRWRVIYPSGGMDLETLHVTRLGALFARLLDRM
jgi:hypothetical protein